MRTVVIILIGVALAFGASILGRRLGWSPTMTLIAFTLVWSAAAFLNMWIGVNRAGYSYREELPIFVAIDLVPFAVAFWLFWKSR